MNENGSVQTLDRLRARLKRLHDTKGLSWRKIASRDEFSEIPHSTLWAIAVNGREPKDEHQRAVLGLPPLPVPVPPCPDCGRVHTQYKTCDHERKALRRYGKRYRSHVEHGRGPTGAASKARLQTWLARNGFENLTEAIDELIGDG